MLSNIEPKGGGGAYAGEYGRLLLATTTQLEVVALSKQWLYGYVYVYCLRKTYINYEWRLNSPFTHVVNTA